MRSLSLLFGLLRLTKMELLWVLPSMISPCSIDPLGSSGYYYSSYFHSSRLWLLFSTFYNTNVSSRVYVQSYLILKMFYYTNHRQLDSKYFTINVYKYMHALYDTYDPNKFIVGTRCFIKLAYSSIVCFDVDTSDARASSTVC